MLPNIITDGHKNFLIYRLLSFLADSMLKLISSLSLADLACWLIAWLVDRLLVYLWL